MNIKKCIKVLLAENEKTVKDLSEYLGVSRNRVYEIMKAENIEMNTLKRCADFFGVSLSELIKIGEQ